MLDEQGPARSIPMACNSDLLAEKQRAAGVAQFPIQAGVDLLAWPMYDI
jgi:hypothetical protein